MTNQKLRQLKARISKLQNWLKEESENTEPPTLADYIQGILSRKAQVGKSGYSQSLYNLKDAAKMLNFLQANNIMDMTGLDEMTKSYVNWYNYVRPHSYNKYSTPMEARFSWYISDQSVTKMESFRS